MCGKFNQLIVFSGMICVIALLVINPNLLNDISKEELALKSKEKSLSLKDSLSFKSKLIILICFCIAVGIVLFNIFRDTKEFQNSNKNSMGKFQKPICTNATINKEEYNKQTEESTKKELSKLYNNPKYQRMLIEKGKDKSNWNWQTKEKESKTIFREGKESSDEDEDLSYV